jgi:hypothetical protein
MPDMHTAMDTLEKTPEHYYIGCTRAKESLFLTYTGSSLPHYFDKFDKTSYDLRSSGQKGSNIRLEVADDLPF